MAPTDRYKEDLDERVHTLFQRCPALCAFAVSEHGPAPADLTCHPPQHGAQVELILEEVSRMLLEFADEGPEAAGLLRGRTFARSVH